MKDTLIIVGLFTVTAAILFHAFSVRFDIVATRESVYKLDRLSGKTTWCYVNACNRTFTRFDIGVTEDLKGPPNFRPFQELGLKEMQIGSYLALLHSSR